MSEETQFDWLRFLLGSVRVTRWVLMGVLGALAGIFATDFLINSPLVNSVTLSKFALFHFVIIISEPFVGELKTIIRASTVFRNYDLLPLIVAGVIYVVLNSLRHHSMKLVAFLAAKDQLRHMRPSRTKIQLADGLKFSSTRADKAGRGLFKRIAFKQEDERTKLLRELAKVTKRLEKTKQKLAFLSVDIVGSTRIKIGNDPFLREHLIREYKEMLEAIFKKYRSRKQSWTPDGVMACFPEVNLAISAAKELLRKLPVFNKDEKKNPFGVPIQVRCGLNAGEVNYDVNYDETDPLELLSSRVLDITGHLQKAALPDSVLVTEEVYRELRDNNGLTPCDGEVDGYRVYQWSIAVPQTTSGTK